MHYFIVIVMLWAHNIKILFYLHLCHILEMYEMHDLSQYFCKDVKNTQLVTRKYHLFVVLP